MIRYLLPCPCLCECSGPAILRTRLILPLLVVAWSSMAAIAADEERADIEPDAAVQSAIALVADAENRAAQQAALAPLEKLNETSPAQLVRQLIFFASRATETKQAMVSGVILRRLEVSDEMIARALAPSLETTDDRVARSIRSILGGLEKRAADRRPDFSLYRGIITERLRKGETLPLALIHYMYEADAGMAMLALMRAHQLREPDEIKRILWAEHVVSNSLWKQQYGFLKPGEVERGTAQELSSLATHEAWWARLYVAEMMRQHTAFQQADVLDALAGDANPAVRAAAARARSTTAPAVQP